MEFLDDGDLYQKIVAHQKNGSEFEEKTVWRTLVQVTLTETEDPLSGTKSLLTVNVAVFRSFVIVQLPLPEGAPPA